MVRTLQSIILSIDFDKVGVITKEDVTLFRQKHYVRKWLLEINSENTRRNYSRELIFYLRATGISIDDLIDLRKQHNDKELYFPARELLMEFREKSKGVLSTAKFKKVKDSVQSFYKNIGCEIQPVGDSYSPRDKKPVTFEMLKKFRNGLDIRGVALIDFLCSVPLRVGQFTKGFYPQFKNIEGFPKLEFGSMITVNAEKGHDSPKYKEGGYRLKQFGFLTESCVKSLTAYMDYREKKLGRKLTGEDYLFAYEEAKNFPTHRGNIRGEAFVSPLSNFGILRILKAHSEKVGIKVTVHSFRNFYNTQLEYCGVDKRYRDIILGHKVSNLTSAYSTPQLGKLKEKILDALSNLELGDGHGRRLNLAEQRLQTLEEENKKLKEKLGKMETVSSITGSVTHAQVEKIMMSFMTTENLEKLLVKARDRDFIENIKELKDKKKGGD